MNMALWFLKIRQMLKTVIMMAQIMAQMGTILAVVNPIRVKMIFTRYKCKKCFNVRIR
jgi:hypothetical protein